VEAVEALTRQVGEEARKIPELEEEFVGELTS
jgi:hypothetical protein